MSDPITDETQIVGDRAMSEALAQLGQTVSVEQTGGGCMTVIVWFADGCSQELGDHESGDWAYQLLDGNGEEVCSGSGDITGGMMVGSVLAYSEEHGGPLDPKTEGMFVDNVEDLEEGEVS